MLRVETFVISPIQSNCYVLSEDPSLGRGAIIVDPGDVHLTPVFDYIDRERLQVTAVWCTHAHFDHVLGVDLVRGRFSIPAYVHQDDVEVWSTVHETAKRWLGEDYAPLNSPDGTWSDGAQVRLGPHTFTILHTPGHSPGSACIIGTDLAFTGDTLFAGTIGRTDLPHSNPEDMQASLRRLLLLDDELTLHPGHMQATTMDVERRTNPFLRRLQS